MPAVVVGDLSVVIATYGEADSPCESIEMQVHDAATDHVQTVLLVSGRKVVGTRLPDNAGLIGAAAFLLRRANRTITRAMEQTMGDESKQGVIHRPNLPFLRLA